ncbi:hypothetical protein ACLOJK_018802, partial [Asimina triloba]
IAKSTSKCICSKAAPQMNKLPDRPPSACPKCLAIVINKIDGISKWQRKLKQRDGGPNLHIAAAAFWDD